MLLCSVALQRGLCAPRRSGSDAPEDLARAPKDDHLRSLAGVLDDLGRYLQRESVVSVAIAGEHRGHDAVMDYSDRRRAIAGGTMAIVPGERLVSGDVVIQLADGHVERAGERVSWRTVGVYGMDGERVAEAWLIALESAAFDEIWTALGRHAP